jgi:hypothetical protein
MCSVSLRRVHNQTIIPVSEWTRAQRHRALYVANSALSGVGVLHSDVVEDNRITASIRRLARDDERAMVTENYLPVVDLAGII